MKLEQAYVQQMVQKGNAYITTPTQHTPSITVVDAPLLGNGDLGAAIKTEADGFAWLLGKNDFWKQAQLCETPSQRIDRLLHYEGRRTGSRIITAGWLRLAFRGLSDNKFYWNQEPYKAVVEGEVQWADGVLCVRSWICAVQNTLVIEVKNASSKATTLEFSMMPGMYQTREVSGYEDGYHKECTWFTYGAEPYNIEGKRHIAAAVCADAPVSCYWERLAEKGGEIALAQGANVSLCLSLLSDLDTPSPKEAALAMSAVAAQSKEALWQAHLGWWQNYWSKSIVETGDEVLDAYYYASLYLLGSCTREGKVPPALFGCWVTSDLVRWSGAYTLNYNYESPFFCLYTANRQDLARSYIEPLLDIIPVGELYAREKYGRRGICLPVEIGPWGMVSSAIFHHQKTNAAYCCTNIFMHYFSTYDEAWGLRAYTFVKKAAEFWEDDLVYENGAYHVIGDSAHEEYYAASGEKNNIHALGLIKMLFAGLLKMSVELKLDVQSRVLWKKIHDELAPFPQFMRNGQVVFKYNEDKYEWLDSNGTPVKFIYPCGCVGLDSAPELLTAARNTLNQKQNLFDNGNAFCEYTCMRARVGCEAKQSYQGLIDTCLNKSYPNRYIHHGGGGIEDFGGIPGSINEMMLQSYDDVIRVFPAWPANKNAKFTHLRAYGAFLVSCELRDNTVGAIEVISEKGKTLTIESPWGKISISINGQPPICYEEKRIIIPTQPDDCIVLCKA